MKKFVSVLLTALLTLSLLTCCAFAETENAPNLTDGYFYLNIGGTYMCYIHFNEDGTYYGSYFGGTANEAGQWQLVDEPTSYIQDVDGDGQGDLEKGDVEAISDQSVVLTNYLTGTPVSVAYVDDQLCDISLAGMANHRYMAHDPEYIYSSSNEAPIQLYLYYANNDIGATFILSHNKTFEDVTGEMFDTGTWEMTGAGEYALTYDFGGTGTLTVSGKTAVLTGEDGTVTELRDNYKEEAVVKVMSLENAEAQVGLPMAVQLRLEGFSDGKMQLVMSVAQANMELILDSGTYEVSASMVPTFHFETAGDLVGTPDYAASGADGLPFTVTYSATVASDAGDLSIDTDLTGNYNPYAE